MDSIILESLCLCLFLVGTGLIIIELRTSFDQCFLLFGILIVVLSLFCMPDVLYNATNVGRTWIQFQHVCASFLCPIIPHYLFVLCRKPLFRHLRTWYLCSVIMTVLFVSGKMLQIADGLSKPTLLYYLTFLPFLLFSFLFVIRFLLKEIRETNREDSRILWVHLVGFGSLIVCGGLDLLQLFLGNEFFLSVNSFTIFGALGIGAVFSYIFSERLITLIRERTSYIARIQESYKELEKARDLSTLGKSFSIINHEIKNQITVILGYSSLILKTHVLPEKPHNMIESIHSAALRVSDLSQDILQFSRAKITIDKRPVDLYQLVSQCIDNCFQLQKDVFTLEAINTEIRIHGDWGKLEQVFLNLFQNAAEAGARHIRIKFIEGRGVLLVSVEDDGQGVAENDLPNLFKAFHTTKKRGTGLGMATSRSIIEGHGGYISALSKNVTTMNQEHGLICSMTFPLYDDTPPSEAQDIVLIEQDLNDIQSILRTFRNVFVNPQIIRTPEHLKNLSARNPGLRVIGAPKAIAEVSHLFECYSLAAANGSTTRVVGNQPQKIQGVFCEEFILSVLLSPNKKNGGAS